MTKFPRVTLILVALLATFAASMAEAQAKKSGQAKKTGRKFGEKKESERNDAPRKRKPTGPELSVLEKALVEDALSAEQVEGLVGKTVNLLRNDGKRVENVKLVKFVTGKDKSRAKAVNVETDDPNPKLRSKAYVCKTLFRIEVEGRSYEFRFVPSQKAYALIDVEQHAESIKSQLEANGYKLWEPLSAEKQEKYVEEEKKFLQEVKEHFSNLPMQLHESRYFLFMSDMPPAQVGPYVVQLDAMNEKLGEAFGFVPGENVWRGKAVVVAFVDKENFKEFEDAIMKLPTPDNVQGLCHTFENGRVVVSINRGESPSFFGAVLVHETSHGYMHRYKSNRIVPRWLNEGIADWIAGVTVPESSVVRDRQEDAAQRLQNTGDLEGLFNGRVPEAWQYGVGSSMVDLLVQHDKEAFRMFFDGIKEGLTWEDSLQRAYGASKEDLINLYAQAIGVEQLQP